MSEPNLPQPPAHDSSWSFAVSLLLTGSALATHPLWLPSVQEAWYSRTKATAKTVCRHSNGLHQHEQPKFALPVRIGPRLPDKPVLSGWALPKLERLSPRSEGFSSIAYAIPAPPFERPTFDYGLPTPHALTEDDG